ncbi:MAG: hypothetical protein KAR87_05545 [Candidatus Aenigmarchaeota archaeon]|nr:hypothetical protein [Candidatus Aenigmarchaeota archaeon]
MGDLKKAMVETGIDKFLELVSIKKSISLKEASKILSVPTDVLENWSNILSKEKIVSIDYDSYGNMVVFITQKNVESKIKKVDSLKRTIEDKTKLVETNIAVKEKDLKEETKQLDALEEKLKKEVGYTKELYIEFEKVVLIEKELNKKVAVLKENKTELSKYIKSTTKNIDVKLRTIQHAEKEIKKYEKIKNNIKKDIDLIKKISRSMRGSHHQIDEKNIKDIEKRQKKILHENKNLNSKYSIINKIVNRFK